MKVNVEKARIEDYDEVIDFGNYVFSHTYYPQDFPTLLPKLYKREYFMDSIHYLIRDEGKIKAVVGAYPLTWEFPDQKLSGRGIGMVAVHPYCRSRGYFKEMMKFVLDDMRQDGIVFGCLSGQRQRYEHFGFYPAGYTYTFSCTETNIRYTLGPEWSTVLSLKPIERSDETILDQIQAIHETKPTRFCRQRERLFDILVTWKAQVFTVNEGSRSIGYLIYNSDQDNGGRKITEINLLDPSKLPEVLGLFLRQSQTFGINDVKDTVDVAVLPNEAEKIAILSRITENYTENPAYQIAVFDFLLFIKPFLKLRALERILAEGSFILQIEGGPLLRLAVEQGYASITETTEQKPELCLDMRDTILFFFSPLAARIFPVIGKSVFLQSLLPLPFFFENVDEI